MAEMSLSFKGLIKDGKKIRLQLDSKLSDLTKLTNSSSSSTWADSAKEPLLTPGYDFDATLSDTEALLSKLSDIIDQLHHHSESLSVTQLSEKKVLEDDLRLSREELEKVKTNNDKLNCPAELFMTFSDDRHKSSNGLNRVDYTLKENTHLMSSHRLVDEQISIAMETKEHLANQRQVFKKVQRTLNDMANRMPLINGLVARIHLRKRRDSLIIGLVVGLCTFALLAFIFW